MPEGSDPAGVRFGGEEDDPGLVVAGELPGDGLDLVDGVEDLRLELEDRRGRHTLVEENAEVQEVFAGIEEPRERSAAAG
jgi:hypothetical protein